MLRINLLKSRTHVSPSASLETLGRETTGAGRIWLTALGLLLVAGVGLYFVRQYMQEGANQKSVAATATPAPTAAAPIPAPVSTPAPAAPPAKPVDSLAGNSTVKPEMISRLLTELEAAATQGVGFSSVEFSTPMEFRVHGLASTTADLAHFQNALAASPGLEFKVDRVLPVKTDTASREFFFSGRTAYAAQPAEVKLLSVDAINAELRSLMALGRAQNIDMEPLRLRGTSTTAGRRRFLYHGGAVCDFSQLQTLLKKLSDAKSEITFRNVALEAGGDEKMSARFDLILDAE